MPYQTPIKTLVLATLAFLTAATAPVVQAQGKPIRLIVPYAPGLFSMMTVPSVSLTRSARARAVTSSGPPAA